MVVDFDGIDSPHALTADEARDLAAQLIEAADELDRAEQAG